MTNEYAVKNCSRNTVTLFQFLHHPLSSLAPVLQGLLGFFPA
jgi:hypothetical protein